MALLKSISSLSDLSDDELIALYRQKEGQDILAQLYLRYSDLVYGTCVKYLEDQEKAKDAVMEIYQELIEKLKSHKVENFKSWLYVVSRNHCLMHLRKDKRMKTTDLDTVFMQSDDFSHLDNAVAREDQL